MGVLLNDINGLVITKCNCSGLCMYGTHSIIVAEVWSAIEKLKPGQKDGSSEVMSIIQYYKCMQTFERLNVHTGILFTIMLRHSLSPDGILYGTMVPMP